MACGAYFNFNFNFNFKAVPRVQHLYKASEKSLDNCPDHQTRLYRVIAPQGQEPAGSRNPSACRRAPGTRP